MSSVSSQVKDGLVQPTDFSRRSPLYRVHQQLNAHFMVVTDRGYGESAAVAAYVADDSTPIKQANQEYLQAQSLGLVDLTTLGRVGFKGRDTSGWLESQNIELPEQVNTTCLSGSGPLVARLARQEYLLLDEPSKTDKQLAKLDDAWSIDKPDYTYPLLRSDSHAWVALTGEHCSELLSKVCAIDMRLHKFANRQLAQTSVARTNGIVIRADQGKTPCFYLLADLSSAEFIWEGLLDAMQEFSGAPIGLKAFLKLGRDD